MASFRPADVAARRVRFHELHASGLFVIPNPWDAGSARLLEWLGFPALATTSSGFAASLGRVDQRTTRDELVAHVASLVHAVSIPVHVDAEACFPEEPGGVARTVELLAGVGAAGCSIEDYDPGTDTILSHDVAVQRVATAAGAAARAGLLLTARAENHLHGIDDLDDTLSRLRAYVAAGAGVAYAPGLSDEGALRRVVESVSVPVNVLALRHGPPVDRLRELGVRRVSTGGGLARAAYGALVAAGRELLSAGTTTYLDAAIPSDVVDEVLSG